MRLPPPLSPPPMDLRHDIHLGLLDGLGEAVHDLLHQLELRASVGADLLLDGHGLGDAHAGGLLGLGSAMTFMRLASPAHEAHLLRLGAGERLDLRGLLLGLGVVGLALVALHLDADGRFRQRRLLLGLGLGFAQLALLAAAFCWRP